MRLSCALARATALVFVLAVSAVRAAEPPPAGAKPLTPEQKERLKERDRLASEARKLGGEGRLAEVVVAWEKKVAIEREVFGAGHAAVALSLEELARMQEYREDFAAARKVRREVLAICRKLHPEGDWRVGDAERALADTERLAGMGPGQRRELGAAQRSNARVVQLSQQDKSPEALPLARRVLVDPRGYAREEAHFRVQLLSADRRFALAREER